MNKKNFVSRAYVAADVAHTKMVAPRGDILDRHVSHNVYMCMCVSALWACVCVNKEKAPC